MEADYCKYVRHCHNCQIFTNVQHVAPSMLYTMTSPWPFSTWGIDIIGNVNPSGTGGHCFIHVAIDYFTKWVKAKSYKVLKAKQVAQFIQNDIICRYGVPHEFISHHGTHFQAETTMSENYKEWPEKIPFALWGYKTSIRIAMAATPYYLVYGMEAVQPDELEIPSLRILLES
ncbi:uncharacterized protein LOC141601681 [Silene latifolia]|uniref:uncharacterized protein LOC141601681 n=1 Tax=Silene latifolia TaxID=37657 RepID=UPI003D77B470